MGAGDSGDEGEGVADSEAATADRSGLYTDQYMIMSTRADDDSDSDADKHAEVVEKDRVSGLLDCGDSASQSD